VACCRTLGRWGGKKAGAADGRREAMSRRDACSGASLGGCGKRSRLAT